MVGEQRDGPSRLIGAVKGLIAQKSSEDIKAPWLSDAPIDLANAKDAFGVDDLIDGLVTALKSARPPFTLSLSGSWGIGKSTVAQAIVARFHKDKLPAVLVDAWTEDVETLRRSLVVAVAAALQARGDERKEADAREMLARQLDENVRQSKSVSQDPKARFGILRSIVASIRNPVPLLGLIAILIALFLILAFAPSDSVLAKAVAPIFGIVAGFLLVNSGYFFVATQSVITTGPAERSELVTSEFRKAVIGKKGDPERVIVVVDNLDRLPGDIAIKALSEIRALVEVKSSRCVFLIPVDRHALVGHISGALDKGAEGKEKAEEAAHAYLDKFFTLDLVLTQPEPADIRDWALEQAREILPATDDDDLRNAVQVVAYVAGSSPRRVKRILNGISSRHLLLSPNHSITLTKLALVESLLEQFPELLGQLSDDPRSFLRARDSLFEADSEDKRNAVVATLTDRKEHQVALRSFLFVYRDFELTAPEIRLILSLRRDREWSGITNPEDLRTAARDGDIAGFETALKATPEAEREQAVERAIYRAERSRSYPLDAMNAVAVAVAVINDFSRRQEWLHDVTVETLLVGGDVARRMITPEIATFVFSSDHRALATVGSLLSTTLANQKEKAEIPLIRSVQIAQPHLNPDSIEAARKAFAALPTDSLEPLFEPSVDKVFVEGPVATALAGQAALLDLSSADQVPTLQALDRLAAYRRAGGAPDPSSFAAIATRLTSQLSAASGPLSKEGLEVLAASTPVIKGLDVSDLDPLVTALQSHTAPDRAPYFEAIFELDLDGAYNKRAATEFDAWLQTGSLEPGPVDGLIRRHAETVDAAGSAWRDLLCRQWLGQGNTGFATIVAELGGPTGTAAVAYAATQAAVPDLPARCREAAEILAESQDDLNALLAGMAGLIASTTPLSAIGTLAPALAALEESGADMSPLIAAVEKRADILTTAAEVSELIASIRLIEDAGCMSIASTSDALGKRALAVAVTDGPAATWVALKSDDLPLAIKVVADTVRSPNVSADEALAAAEATRARLNRSSEVALALAERAAAPTTNESDAERLLQQAKPWRPQPSSSRADYESKLSEVARRWPALDELVNELKLVGKRR